MAIDTIWIGNANTISLTDFRDAATGALENDVTAFGSLCYLPPSTATWLITGMTGNGVSPIVVTSAAHGLTTGQYVTLVNAGDNTAANGTWQITVIDGNNFSLNGSTGNAAWSTGGQFWQCVQDCNGLPFTLAGNGLYQLTIDGNVGLVNQQQYAFVIYCTGGYAQLYQEVDRVTARLRGNY